MAKNLRSIPFDIADAEMADIFKGLAIYNTGTITVAYQRPVLLRQIRINGQDLLADRMTLAILPGQRVEFEAALWVHERRRR